MALLHNLRRSERKTALLCIVIPTSNDFWRKGGNEGKTAGVSPDQSVIHDQGIHKFLSIKFLRL